MRLFHVVAALFVAALAEHCKVSALTTTAPGTTAAGGAPSSTAVDTTTAAAGNASSSLSSSSSTFCFSCGFDFGYGIPGLGAAATGGIVTFLVFALLSAPCWYLCFFYVCCRPHTSKGYALVDQGAQQQQQAHSA